MKYEKIINDFYKKNFKKNYFANHSPLITKSEIKEVRKCIKSSFVSTAGNYPELFKKKISKFLKAKYIVPVNSGTSALHLAMILSGLQKGDEVLMPSLTFVATANSAIYTGASPHFVDVKKETLSIDFEKLNVHLSKFKFRGKYLYNHVSKKFIRALVLVHTYGYSGDVDKAKKLCKKYNLKFIEDAAESLGSYYKKKHTGTFGDFGCLSFNGNKVVTTGAGGLVILKRKSDFIKAISLANVSKKKIPHVFDFDDIGYNYKMPSLNASFGYAQLKNLKKILKMKNKIHLKYKFYFKKFKEIHFYSDDNILKQKSNNWLNTILLDDKKFTKKKYIKFIKILNHKNINVRPTWKPIHKLHYLKNFHRDDLSVTNYLQYKLFNLPSSPNMIFYEK